MNGGPLGYRKLLVRAGQCRSSFAQLPRWLTRVGHRALWQSSHQVIGELGSRLFAACSPARGVPDRPDREKHRPIPPGFLRPQSRWWRGPARASRCAEGAAGVARGGGYRVSAEKQAPQRIVVNAFAIATWRQISVSAGSVSGASNPSSSGARSAPGEATRRLGWSACFGLASPFRGARSLA